MSVLVVGGAGFIGGHLMSFFAKRGIDAQSYDLQDGKDAKDRLELILAMRGCDTVVHLASNPDIAAAAATPMIDFDNGTVVTANVVEAARICGVHTIMYASGSGIYGDWGMQPLSEDHGPLVPTSPYGASKLAGEALVSAYCHMFGMRGIAFRFANVVGPGQTHGVGLDFINKLKADPTRLEVLGDGNQSKSYIHVDDVISAIDFALSAKNPHQPFTAYNVATLDRLPVWRIASDACKIMDAHPSFSYTGGSGGWKGDIPVVSLDSNKIRRLGWETKRNSREAMWDALRAIASA